MKKLFYLLVLTVLFFSSCKKDDDDEELFGNWVNKFEFKGDGRDQANTFIIGNKAYVMCGYSYANNKQIWYNDVWEYDPANGAWLKKADFPGTLRTGAVSFSIGTKGYFGTGYSKDYDYLADFWEFDPDNGTLGTWTKKDSLKGPARFGAVGFGVNGKGYITTGCYAVGKYLNDTWVFDPTAAENNQWTENIGSGSFPGFKRMNALVFNINDKIYLGTGRSNSFLKDFWIFDPAANTWTVLRDIANTSDDSYDDSYSILREYGCAFVIDGKAYIHGGTGSNFLNDTWEYDPNADLWKRVSYFEDPARTKASCFSVSNRGFILLGSSGSTYFSDIWEFKPGEKINEKD